MISSLNIIELLTFILILQLVLYQQNANNGLNLLLLSEGCWLTLYALYVIGAFINNLITLGAVGLFLIIFAAVDCSIWLIFLVYIQRAGVDNTVHATSIMTRFLYRTNRLLRSNRFIR
uniref:NADH dehydrogenase subunit 4 L n=1 Tax=Nyctotherus ovalis TaxID=70075 RepID=Q5DUY5_NYCOV|nr:NADH dehydrogenase subunit 4 L [Nyctotherus ovalis]